MGASSHARARLLAVVVVAVVVRLHVVVRRRGTRRPAWRELRATTGGELLRAVAHGGAPARATVRAARPRNEDNVLVLRTVSLPYFPTYLEARNRRVGKVSPLPCYPAPAPQLGP